MSDKHVEFFTVKKKIILLRGLLIGDKTLFCLCPTAESTEITWNVTLDRMSEMFTDHYAHKKRSNEFTEYQHPEQMAPRNPKNDRVHPLDTVSILEFKTDYKRDIENVFIHYGGYADEMARSHNAFAITMANHIYFRSNAYNPHSEEGRKLLAHELTHVAQHTEGVITKNTSRDNLEHEAEQAEKIAEYDDDPIMTVEIYGHRYRFRRSKMKGYAKAIAGDIKEWMLEQKAVRSDESYLKLLCRYEKWLKRPM